MGLVQELSEVSTEETSKVHNLLEHLVGSSRISSVRIVIVLLIVNSLFSCT